MKLSIPATAALLTLSFVACSPTVVTRGNLVSQAKFEQIQPKKSTRADLLQAWGPPTTTSSFDQNTWYYIGETTSQQGIYAPEVEKRRMIRVRFDTADSDTVAAVEDLDPAQARNIQFVSRKTPAAGRQYTALQQFIGNIGKYNPSKTNQ